MTVKGTTKTRVMPKVHKIKKRQFLKPSLNKIKAIYVCNRASVREASHVRYLPLHHSVKSPLPKRFFEKVGIESCYFHHSGGKNHVCHVCDKAFAFKRNYQSHLLSHKYKVDISNKENVNLLLIKEDLKSRGYKPVRRSKINTFPETKVNGLCYSSQKSRHQVFWHATACKEKHLDKMRNKNFLHKVGIKMYGLKKYQCQVCTKLFVGKRKFKNHLHAHISKKSHVCDVDNIAYSKKGRYKSHHTANKEEKAVLYKLWNVTQDSSLKINHASPNESPQMCRMFNPVFESQMKTQFARGVSKSKSNFVAHIYKKLHKYEKLKNFEENDFKRPPFANEVEKPHIYSKLNRIVPSKFKNCLVAHKEKKSYEALNITQLSEINSFFDSYKDVQSHIYEELNLLEGNETVNLLATHQREESSESEVLNKTGRCENWFKIYKDKDSHIYEALNHTEESEIKSGLVTYKDEDSPTYEALNLAQEKVINSRHVTYEDESPHFATHIDESHLFKSLNPSQVSNVKTCFSSRKDEISPVFEVLNLAEDRELETPLIAHSNKMNLDDSCKRSFRQKLGQKKHSFSSTGIKYVCHVCNQTFAVKFCLQSHLLTHPKEKLHTCQMCNLIFSEKDLLKSHLSTHIEELHVCNVCGRTFAQQSNLKTHQLTHKNVKNLSKARNTNFCLKRPKRSSFKHTGMKKFVCHVCDKAFAIEWCFQNHMLTHQRETYHVCHVCHAAFSEEISLQNHLVAHTDKDPLVLGVDISSRSINLKARLATKLTNQKMNNKYSPLKVSRKRGSFKHTGVKKHQCDECNLVFAFKWSLQRHLRTHSSGKVSKFFEKDNTEIQLLTRSNEEPCVSEQCSQVPLPPTRPSQMFSKYLSQKASPKTPRYKRNQVRKHKCTICSKEFAMKLNLRRHLITHTNINSQVSFSEYSPEDHHVTHTDELDESKVFNKVQGSNLDGPLPTCVTRDCYFPLKVKHKIFSFKHTRVKKHKCNVCNKSFSMKRGLRRHQIAHTCGNSHVCQECHIAFSEKLTLESHLLKHRDEAPKVCNQQFDDSSLQFLPKHFCNTCNQVFSQKVWLKVHNFKHIGAKKHVCMVCDKAFAMQWNLQRHLRTHNSNLGNPSIQVELLKYTMINEQQNGLFQS